MLVTRALNPRRIARSLVTVIALTLVQIISSTFTPASAAGAPVVTMPVGGWVVAQNVNTTIPGVSVSGLGTNDTYLITIALNGTYTGSTLKIGTPTNLTASYGYSSSTFSSFTKISFTGIAADINAALATLQYMAGAGQTSGTTPSISVSAVENISGLAYNSFNNHYYKAYSYGSTGMIVGTNITDKKQSTALAWAATQTFAGQAGYLVTITSADENTFVSNTIPGAQNIWIGARDSWSGSQGGTTYTFGEGYWGWASTNSPEFGAGFSRDGTSGAVTVDGNGRFVSSGSRAGLTTSYASVNTAVTATGAGGGSSNGYFNWCSNEPNNADSGNSGEHVGVTNWNNGTCWNDLADANNSGVSGFVVEFGTSAADGGFTNAVTTSAKVYVAPTLTRLSGNNQVSETSTALARPIKAVFKDSMGTPIPNNTIAWSTARGTRSADTSTTDVNGIATLTSWIMPSTAGFDTLTASFSGGGNPSITFSARAGAFSNANALNDTAMVFDGSTQYAVATGQTILPTATNAPFTLEAWVFPTAVGAQAAIFSQGGSTSKFYIKRQSGKLVWNRDGWGVSEQVCGYFPNNDWTHIALTFDGASTVKCYMNGALTLTTTITNGSTSLNAPAVIGQYSGNIGDSSSYFPGQIDEVKIWNYVRDASGIATDLATHTDTATVGLLGYYDFNEGSGSTIYNLIRNDSSSAVVTDFTAVGSPTWDESKIRTISTAAPYTTITFKRNFLIAAGGWTVPAGVSRVLTLVVAGGGGGGGGYQGGGGGAGGFIETITTIAAQTTYPITVGAGGLGFISGVAVDAGLQPTNGRNSVAFGSTAIGGGYGASERVSPTNVHYAANTGGSGGGGTWGADSSANGKRYGKAGTSGQGNKGGDNNGTCCMGAGGGGAGAVGVNTTSVTGGAGGAGLQSAITGTFLAGGGGGAFRNTPANSGSGGNGGGGDAAKTTTDAVDVGSGAKSGTANTGGGGGGGVLDSSNADGLGGNGGSGIVAIRWITASKPVYTKPTNAYLNVGMTETFTTNVAVDSATVGLTRTFRWESTTTGANGTFTLIKQGTGAANAAFSWVPTDTRTSGSNFLYRLIVTDSDTAGLFITDSSTAFAVINLTLVLTSKRYISKTVGIPRMETFTVANGTPTYTYSLSPPNPFFWIDTVTALTPRIRISDTATIGTYYETFTVTDSVSASIVVPMTIVISTPPSFSASSAQVDSSTVLYLDTGNTASYPGTGTTINDLSGRGLSADLNWSSGTTAVNAAGTSRSTTSALNNITCTAPTYDRDGNGSLIFNGSSTCGYVSGFGYQPRYSYELWFKRNGSQTTNANLINSPNRVSGDQMNYILSFSTANTLVAGIYNGTTFYWTPEIYVPARIWTHVAVTFDGSTLSLIINGDTTTTVTPVITWNPAILDNGLLIGRKYNDTQSFNGSIGSLRFYSRALSIDEIRQNINVTKTRFDGTLNENTISQKYASRFVDTYTVTSGSETLTATFTTNALSGIKWDTTTARSLVLTLQDTLTPGTYYDTITATDIYGSTSRLPLTFNIAKADTITVYVETPTALNYTGNRAIFPQTLRVIGLTGLESGSATSATVKFKPGGGTCATGGYCRVGDIGPGGGIVFIDTSTARADGRIYEVAPYNWSGSDDLSTAAPYCSNDNLLLGADKIAFGGGETNTNLAKSQCLGGAVAKVNTFNQSNSTGFSDWYIPDSNEASALIDIADQAGLVFTQGNWPTGSWGYWTSTELSATVMRSIGGPGNGWSIWNLAAAVNKSEATRNLVRPIRYFNPCWAVDTCTSLITTETPTAAGTYGLVPSSLTISSGSLNNYAAVNYIANTLTINKIAPKPLITPWINTNYPDTFTINVSIYAGNGALKYTTTNGTATGCALDYKKIYTSSQGTCIVTIARYADRNYTADTVTATIFFLALVSSQPTNQVGSGATIGLNGKTSLTIDDSSTARSPRIISFTINGSQLTINGEGFGSSPVTVTFERYVNASPSPTPTMGGTVIVVTAPVGAISGPVLVITSGGRDSIDWVDLP